jgi:ClpP class serine protease
VRDLDDLRRELSRLHLELGDVPEGDLERRQSIHEQQEKLRSEVQQLLAADRTALEAELADLEQRWKQLAAKRIDVVAQAGDISAGGNFGFTADAQRINRAIDEAHGRTQIEDRIKRIREMLDGE